MRWLVLLFVLTLSEAEATDIHAQIERLGFVESAIPPARPDASQTYQPEHFGVRIEGSRLLIDPWGPTDWYPRTNHEINGFRYTGYHGGEWGGNLTVMSPSGHEQVLFEDNIQAIHPVGDDLLVFAGLSHLGLSRGAVYRVTDAGYSPSAQRFTLLPEAPNGVIADLRREDIQQFIVVGNNMLMMLFTIRGKDFIRISHPHQETPWLGATSAVMVGDTLVVGMRGGIATTEIDRLGRFLAPIRYFLPEGSR
jgi:hypothetical protein